MEILLSIDDEKLRMKPVKEQAAAISVRIGKEKRLMELSQIARAVGEEGRTFCPAVFHEGKRKADMFAGMQLFPLDFDGEISYREVRERAERYDLPICLSYHTLSSNPGKEKFRVCFLHECEVTDKRAAELIIRMLMNIFEECDGNCSDVCRMFYGGKGVIEKGQGTFDIVRLAVSFQTCLRQREASQYKRNLEHFAEKCGVSVEGSSLSIFSALSVGEEGNVDFTASDCYILIGKDENSTRESDFYVIKRYHKSLRSRPGRRNSARKKRKANIG